MVFPAASLVALPSTNQDYRGVLRGRLPIDETPTPSRGPSAHGADGGQVNHIIDPDEEFLRNREGIPLEVEVETTHDDINTSPVRRLRTSIRLIGKS